MKARAGRGGTRGSVGPRATARRSEAAYAALYGGLFLSLGAQMAFLPLWLETRGLTDAEIGLANSLAVGVRIIAGLAAPALSDRLGRPRGVMAASGGGAALIAAALAFIDGHAALYALTALLAACYAALIPLSDAHGYAAAERLGFSYRRARSVGSAAFLIATLIGGAAMAAFGADAALWIIGAAMAGAAVAAWSAPVARRPKHAANAGPATRRAWMLTPRFALFLAAAAAAQASHGVYYVYGSVHWRTLGYGDAVIGALWSVGVFAEILLFLFGQRVMERLGPARALMMAGAAAMARWGAMTLDPPLVALLALQCLHGATFGLAHLAAVAFVHAVAPPDRRATGQGAVSAIAGGVGMLLASIGATALYPAIGADAYWLGAALGGAAAAAAWGLARCAAPPARTKGWPRREND